MYPYSEEKNIFCFRTKLRPDFLLIQPANYETGASHKNGKIIIQAVTEML
jgi:hypothetical protein